MNEQWFVSLGQQEHEFLGSALHFIRKTWFTCLFAKAIVVFGYVWAIVAFGYGRIFWAIAVFGYEWISDIKYLNFQMRIANWYAKFFRL